MLDLFLWRPVTYRAARLHKDWNNLPPDIAAAKSLESFKAQVAKLFE
jgi:DNA mismatch repair protein MutH